MVTLRDLSNIKWTMDHRVVVVVDGNDLMKVVEFLKEWPFMFARTRLNPLHLVFVDLRKAFDSVSHDTIVRAAVRMGVPAPRVSYLRVYYQESGTRLLDCEMVVTNGVRQGDPHVASTLQCGGGRGHPCS